MIKKSKPKTQAKKTPTLLKRTHYCGDLSPTQRGQNVTVMGWIDSQRHHGGVLFIGLRDRSGVVQVVLDLNEENGEKKFDKEELKNLKNESVLAFWGPLRLRPEAKKNLKLKTGAIEIQCEGFHIFSKARDLPFQVSTKFFDFPTNLNLKAETKEKGTQTDETKNKEPKPKVSESLRARYRYLDLRSPKLQNFLFLRHQTLQYVRQFFSKEGFWEIETPILYKSTPEGARDYLVPSRTSPGKFYALPQSPQTLKQLLMISGIDKYFQIARCFRDEDLRENRQPEFTQIDMEMSFIQEEKDIMELNERLLKYLWKNLLGIEIKTPLPCLSYKEALERHGTDSPDLRIPWEFKDLSSVVSTMNIEIFKKATHEKDMKVMALKLPKLKNLSKTFLRKWADKSKEFKAKGLIWIFKTEGKFTSPIEKILSQKDLKKIFSSVPFNQTPDSFIKTPNTEAKEEKKYSNQSDENTILFLVADQRKIAFNFLLSIRSHFAKELKILEKKKFSFLWVKDFPLLEFNKEEKKWNACHHPFTRPKEDQLPILLKKEASQYSKIQSKAYDLVCNGLEIAGGSLRNHQPEVQKAIFHALNLSEKEIKEKFGFLIEALDYGVPPHGGIAWGFDRLISILCGTSILRDIIAFPKTRKAIDPTSDSPSDVPPAHLKELGIKILTPPSL